MITYTDIIKGNLDAIREFYQEHNVNCQLAHGTPLTLSAFEGRVKVVKCLLDAGADPNYLASNGWTPLIAAANDGRKRVVEILLDAGADPNLADTNGKTALHHLCFCPRKVAPEIVPILIKRGANPLQQDLNGETAYQLALREKTNNSYIVNNELIQALKDVPTKISEPII
jgi:ankyrin repeat protein